MNKVVKSKGSARSGLILPILVLVAVAAPISLNKVSPIAPILMKNFNIGETQIGMLISVFSITGILLALPGGGIINKFGPWKCILAALIALMTGSLIGSYSDTYSMLLFSRIVEGVGMTLIAIAGPSIIGTTVSSKRRGVAMGLFSGYMGIGQVITYNLAPRLVNINGWKGVWWFSTVYIIVFTCIWILLMLKIKAFTQKVDKVTKTKAEAYINPTSPVLKNRNLWFLALSICFYIISYVSIQMFLPSYLSSQRGIEMAKASSLVSICCFVGVIFSMVAGLVSDKLGSRRVLGGMSLIISGGLFAIIPFTPTPAFPVLIILLGMIPPILPVCVFSAATEVIDDPSRSGVAMGLISMGQNIGLTVGPTIFGAVAQGAGWNQAFFFTIPVAVVGGLIMLANGRVR